MERAWNVRKSSDLSDIRSLTAGPYLQHASQVDRDDARPVPVGSAAYRFCDGDVDTRAGAEDGRATVKQESADEENIIPTEGTELPNGLPEDLSYNCDYVDCLWPCSHHDHDRVSRDFFWSPQSILRFSDCPYCSIFATMVKKCCFCNRLGKRGGPVHRCRHIYFEYDGNIVSSAQLASTCGSMDLDVGIFMNKVDCRGRCFV